MAAAWAGAWLLLSAGASSAPSAAFLPGPAPQHRAQPAAELNRRCEACHTEIAREWRDSFHRRSYSDRAVQRALQQEPRPFCRSCHAPEADPATAATGWPAENGVSCVTCHVRPDRVSSATRSGCLRTPSSTSPEPTAAKESSACERCHEFSFPDGQARVRPELMQATRSEHRASAWAEQSCVSCHMPRVGPDRHRTHRFLGGHDAQLLRSALQVRATRAGREIQIALTPILTGHAFPTGDMLRRLAVTVTAVPPDGRPAVAQVRYLGRHFGVASQRAGQRVLVTHRDDRVREPTTLAFTLAESAAEMPVTYRVSYQRVLFPGPGRLDGSSLQPDSATLDGEIELARGELAAVRSAAQPRSDRQP